jgi:hypothetical protein
MTAKTPLIREGLGSTEPLVFPRRFQLWAYSVSHSQLLLRSNRSQEEPTRIDVGFRGVVALKLAWILGDLTLSIADAATQARIEAENPGLDFFEKKLFVCQAGDFAGWVLASTVAVAEDYDSYESPSHVFEPWLLRTL